MTNFREIDVSKSGDGRVTDPFKVRVELERANISRHGMHVKLGEHERALDEMDQRLSVLETGSMNVRLNDHSTIDVTVKDPRVSDLQKQIDGLRTVLIQRVEELRAVDRHSSDRIDAAIQRLNTAEVNVADTHLLARDNERRLDEQAQALTPAQRVANALRSEARRGGYLSAAAMEAMADTLDGKE